MKLILIYYKFLKKVHYCLGLDSSKTKIFAVEPVTANTMYRSFEAGKPADLPSAASVASGLAPPFCGRITYDICKRMIDGVLLVSIE